LRWPSFFPHLSADRQGDTGRCRARAASDEERSVTGHEIVRAWSPWRHWAPLPQSDGEASGGRPLPFNSKSQFNISPYFENDRLAARITYNWRDKYFTRVSGSQDLWTMDYHSLDASVTYKVNDYLSVGLEGMNLLDEQYHSYFGNEKLLNGAYKSGRRYMASLRFAF